MPPSIPAPRLLQEETRLADAMPIIVWTNDAEGQPLFMNSKWTEYTGVTPEESIRLGVQTFVHPDDLEAVLRASRDPRAVATGYEALYRLRRRDGQYRWHVARVVPLARTADGAMALSWIGTAMDIHERRENEQRRSFLIEATKVLGTSLDLSTTLNDVARLMIPHLADWCAIDLLDDSGALVRHAVAHIDPSKVALGWELFRRLPPRPADSGGAFGVIRSRVPQLQREDPDPLLEAGIADPELLGLFRKLRLRSWILAPLIARGRVLGTVTLVWSESGRVYDDDDVVFAMDFAQRVSTAVDNARLYQLATEARVAAEALAAEVIDQTQEAQNALIAARAQCEAAETELAALRLRR